MPPGRGTMTQGSRVRRGVSGQAAEAGFAAIDALTALAILSVTLGLAVQAVDTARRTALAALEARRAEAALDGLLGPQARALGVTTGAWPGFDWSLQVEPLDPATDASPSRLCRRALALTARPSGRVYRASTVGPCPRPEAAR
jgi:hypothetical protein